MFDFRQRYQEITGLLQRYQELRVHCDELIEENEQYKKQKAELFSRFGKRYGNIKTGEARNYTEQELMELRIQLANSAGVWALIKSMLGFGKSQKDVYAELMSNLNGLLYYMEEQIRNREGEAAAILNRLYQNSEEYSLAYKSVKRYSGCNEDSNWQNYEMPESLDNERIFLGDFLKPLLPENGETESELPESTERGPLFKKCREGQSLYIPWGFTLSNPVQLCIDYKAGVAESAREILHTMIYQILRNIPQYYMEFHFMDAVTSGNDFRDFIRLQQVRKTDAALLNRKVTGGNYQLARSYLKSEDISEGLSSLVQKMTVVINEKAPYSTVTEYNAERGMDAWIPYQVVIIENLQENCSDTDLKNLQYLIENGRNLGVFVVILNNGDRWRNENTHGRKTGLDDCFSPETWQNLVRISLDESQSSIAAVGITNNFHYWRTGESHQEFIEKVVAALGSEKKLDNEFQRIFDLTQPFGQMDSTDGLHIPFAVSQRGRIVSYSLGQAMNAHGLICGGTGSGKSSLLHMLISSIVMNYTPEDVEIWLADYKITEFYSYKTNTPPHIRFIGLSKSSDFSYAFLDKIVSEMERRQNLIAQADHQYKVDGGKNNITSFTDYRKVNGKNSMTRLLIIVDEFHVMSQHAQLEPDYKTKLENILSEARALGITLLLSDQAIVDGLRGLSDKGKKQIKARIALSNYKDELKETLNVESNDELRSLIHMKVGEVAVQTVKENEDREEVATLERATAIYINGTCRYNVNEKARAYYCTPDYTADVFDDRVVEPMKIEEIEQWEKEHLTAHRDGREDLYIYLGRPVNLDFALSFPLLQRKGNNIMCVSGTEEQQMRIFHAITASFARQDDFAVRIMADQYAGIYREYKPEILEFARTYEEIEVYDDLGSVCYETSELTRLLRNRGNRKKYLIVWLGLDAMADLLAEEKKGRPEVRNISGSSSEKEGGIPEDHENRAYSEFQDAALNEFQALFGENDLFGSGDSKENTLVEAADELNEEDENLYDARDDIARIIHLGPTCNIFNFVIYDSASALRDFREVKTSDFNHKIAFQMSDYEAGEFLEQPRLIRDLAEHLGYYHNGRSGSRFIPYKL